ncbi:unnamed protein product [Lymnaea stagnalis]|uniref:Transmembrane protein 199 n=1 Tax=Lymnaea stagnalis TaxID=6523 RepID=A0AAV2HDQ8_LYMST
MADQTKVLSPVLQVTPTIKQVLEKVLKCKCITEPLKNQCSSIISQSTDEFVISTKIIREVYNTLRKEGHKVFLHEIVEDALVIPQSVTLPPRSPELEERVRKLKIIEENREYKRMTRNVGPRYGRTLTFQEEVKSLNKQLVTVFNFLVTVFAGFAFGYKGAEMVIGNQLAMKMLSGLTAGLVVFFVDLYFLMRYAL